MTSPNAPDPVELAKIAAQLNPKLACDDPAKAIELARKLLLAADPELAEEEALRAEGKQLRKEGEREDKLFPSNECISFADAFKASHGPYKTERGFVAALRKEKLTTVLQQVDLPQWGKALPHEEEKFVKCSEVTTIRAVQELFRRQRKATQAQDRKRKATTKKKIRKMSWNSKGKKRNESAEKRNPKPKKRKRQSKKRKPQKPRKAS